MIKIFEFKEAVYKLINQLENLSSSDDSQEFGHRQLSQNLSLSSEFSSIEWCSAQNIFPKFYWCSRNNRQEIVALGALKSFTKPPSSLDNLTDNQKIYGGSGFNINSDIELDNKKIYNPQNYFFLPQIELTRFDKNWQLTINLSNNNNNLEDDINLLKSLIINPPPLLKSKNQITKITHLPNQKIWGELVDKAILAISHDQFKKVVLARQTKVKFNNPISACQLLKISSEHNHNCYHFMLAVNSNLAFLGSSPECLYQRQDKALQSEALAGTIGRGENPLQDIELANWLMQDSKNTHELQFVVDDIVEQLTPYTSKIEVEKQARIIRLRKVQHLKREISAELLDNINCEKLLELLQPTAAVAGLPRKSARNFICTHEPFNRGWYSGSFGFISKRWSEFTVAIRSALIDTGEIVFYAGAGIVAGSNPNSEWQELEKKTATLLSLLEN